MVIEALTVSGMRSTADSVLVTSATAMEASNMTSSASYDYDYPMDDFLPPLQELLPVSITYGLTLLFGITGNVLVIVSVTCTRRLRTVTNAFLVSLATADLLIVLLCVPIKFAKFFSYTWQFGVVLCKLVHYLQSVFVLCSIHTLTAMSIERYNAIIHPMRSKYTSTVSRARRVILVVWLIAFILASPILYGQSLMPVGRESLNAYWCRKQWDKLKIDGAYELYMMTITFLLPLAIISYTYANICRELWMVVSRRKQIVANNKYDCGVAAVGTTDFHTNSRCYHMKQSKQSSEDDRTKKQAVKMLLAVVCLFAICWGPTFVDDVMAAFGVVDSLNYGYLKPMRQAFANLAYLHSCLNPIVYTFMSKAFRDQFRAVVTRLFWCSWCPLFVCCKQGRGAVRGREGRRDGRLGNGRTAYLMDNLSMTRGTSLTTAVHVTRLTNGQGKLYQQQQHLPHPHPLLQQQQQKKRQQQFEMSGSGGLCSSHSSLADSDEMQRRANLLRRFSVEDEV